MSGDFLDIYFGRYLPDLGGAPNPDEPGYLTDAVGIRSTPNGYRGAPSFATVAGATAVGAAFGSGVGAGFASATTRNFFICNAFGGLYESTDDGVTWSDETPGGTALTGTGYFFQYGDDAVYVDMTRAALRKSLTGGVAAFANLGGSPPIAVCGARVRQHAVLGYLIGVDPYAVQWSAIGNHQDWPTPGTTDALAKESGRQSNPSDLGIVQTVLGGEKIGVVVQEEGLTRMTYEGGNTGYAFDTYERKIGFGKYLSTRFTTDGNYWYWYNETGLYATDGYSVNVLSEGRIDEAIFNQLLSHANQSSLAGGYTTASSAYDGHRKSAIFGCGNTGYQLVYNTRTRECSWLHETGLSCLFAGIGPGSISSGAASARAAYNLDQQTRKLQRLSANTAALALQTGYIEIYPGFSVQLEGVHLLGAGVPGSLGISYKAAADLSTADVSQSGFTALTAQSRGMKSAGRATSQFFAFRVTGTGAESQLLRGLRVYYSRAQPSP